MVSECNEENVCVVGRCAVAFHGLFLVRDIMVCFVRQKNVVDARRI